MTLSIRSRSENISTFVDDHAVEFRPENVRRVAMNSLSECSSTTSRWPTSFFNGNGMMSVWTDHKDSHVQSMVCVFGGAYQVATRTLGEVISTGLTSSSMEVGGEVISAELACVYALDKSGTERLAARHMMSFLESKLRNKSLSAANKILANADVAKLSSRSLIGMVRSTYRIKNDLPSWENVYVKSWRRIKEMGKDPQALFIGLPPAEEVELASTSK